MQKNEISAEALALAQRANEEYDLRIGIATRLASILTTMDSGAFEKSIIEVAAENAEQEFNLADRRFNTYLNAAAVLMPSQTRLEQIDIVDIEEPTTKHSHSSDQSDQIKTEETIGIYEARYSMNSSALGRKFGVSHVTIKTAATELGDKLGDLEGHRDKRGRFMPKYNESQQEMIRQKLEANGSLVDVAPEGVLTRFSIAEQLGVSEDLVKDEIDNLGDQLGEISLFRHGKSKTTGVGFTPEQQEIIRSAVEAKLALYEHAPKYVYRMGIMVSLLGVSDNTIKREVERLGDAIGEVRKYRFTGEDIPTLIAPGYSSDQLEKIRQSLEDRGFFVEVAPEGVLSAKDLAKSLGVDYGYVRQAAKELADDLGEVKSYRNERRRGRNWLGYNLEQQEIIKNHRLIKNYLERNEA